MKKYAIVIIFCSLVMGMFLGGFGLNGIVQQDLKMNRYLPVEATIIKSKVFYDGENYHPAITYKYSVSGKDYISDRAVIFKTHEGEKWAKSIVSRNPEGRLTTIYYNPSNPSKSFLVKQYVFLEAYGLVLFSIPCFFIAFVAWKWKDTFNYGLNNIKFRKIPNTPWYEVPADFRVTDRLKWSLLTFTFCIIALPVCMHYFLKASPPYDETAFYGVYVYIGLSLIPFGYLVYALLILMCVKEPIICINSDKLSLGRDTIFRFCQKTRKKIDLDKVTVSLICQKQIHLPHKSAEVGWTTVKELCYEETFKLNDRQTSLTLCSNIEFEKHILIPIEQVPSSVVPDDDLLNIPYYVWYFVVTEYLFWKISYKIIFPIKVDNCQK